MVNKFTSKVNKFWVKGYILPVRLLFYGEMMGFVLVEATQLEPNPFQIRKWRDEEALRGMAKSMEDELGVRSPPLVRPIPGKPDRYQIAFGHGRALAAAMAGKSLWVRVEPLTDRQMKTEVLTENLQRQDLDEDEKWLGVEQVREDYGLSMEDRGSMMKLAEVTGMPPGTLSELYDTRKMREHLPLAPTKQVSSRLIHATGGLEIDDRVKLVKKATKEDWGSETTRNIKKAIEKMPEEVKKEVLKPENNTPPKVIERLSEVQPEKQAAVLKVIREERQNEDTAIKTIEMVKTDRVPQTFEVKNSTERVVKDFNDTLIHIKGWGYNQYGILGDVKWAEARAIFTEIETQMRWLKTLPKEE